MKKSGFALIALILALSIVIILFAYYLKPSRQKENTIQTGRNAEAQLQNSNQKLQNYQTQLQQSTEN